MSIKMQVTDLTRVTQMITQMKIKSKPMHA